MTKYLTLTNITLNVPAEKIASVFAAHIETAVEHLTSRLERKSIGKAVLTEYLIQQADKADLTKIDVTTIFSDVNLTQLMNRWTSAGLEIREFASVYSNFGGKKYNAMLKDMEVAGLNSLLGHNY